MFFCASSNCLDFFLRKAFFRGKVPRWWLFRQCCYLRSARSCPSEPDFTGWRCFCPSHLPKGCCLFVARCWWIGVARDLDCGSRWLRKSNKLWGTGGVLYGCERLERLAAAKTPLWDFPGQTVGFDTKDNADSVKQSMFLYRFEAGEGTKDRWWQREELNCISVAVTEACPRPRWFFFQRCWFTKEAAAKARGEKKASGDSFEHCVLF